MNFGDLALIMAVALAGPALAALPGPGVPLMVGELLAGVVIGKTGFGWIDANGDTLAFIGQIGFALLMLVAGTHLPLRQPGLRGALGHGLAATALAFGLAAPLAILLSHITPLHHAGVLLVLLATSSAAVVMPVLGARSASALVTVAWVAIADVATVIAIPIVLAKGDVGKVIAGSALIIVLAVLLFFGVRQVDRRDLFDRHARESLARGWGLRLRLSLVALFTLAWIANEFETSVLIAGFGVGAVIAMSGEPKSVASELIGVGEGFLIPVFFVTLGARLDVRALFSEPKNLGLLAALLVAIVLVHVIVALVLRAGIAGGLLASAQLGVPSAIASLGLANGTLKPGQGAAIVTAALCSVGVSAIGAARLPPT
ncbi:MAG: hypothetical protein QOF76_577 [Solirubrobacteraceae bacterium]|nr:hypothetical protein [Solirubrobacteraceae bacterium]